MKQHDCLNTESTIYMFCFLPYIIHMRNRYHHGYIKMTVWLSTKNWESRRLILKNHTSLRVCHLKNGLILELLSFIKLEELSGNVLLKHLTLTRPKSFSIPALHRAIKVLKMAGNYTTSWTRQEDGKKNIYWKTSSTRTWKFPTSNVHYWNKECKIQKKLNYVELSTKSDEQKKNAVFTMQCSVILGMIYAWTL